MVVNDKALIAATPIVDMMRVKVKHNGVSHGLSEAGYDIRIKQEIHFFPGAENKRFVLVDRKEQKAGRFTLGSSIEEFDMPNHLMGIVHDKSTWARKGLSVFNTVIEPGWKGFLTLELVYHGVTDLFIPAGSGIAQVIFHQVAIPTSYDGKYQNQEDKPVAARDS